MWRRLQSFAPILAGTLMIMGVVLFNGGPSVFTDTDDYYVEGRTFAVSIADFLHLHAEPPPSTDPDDIADAKETAADLQMSHTEIGARSPYYGLLLYATQRTGTLWLTALVQGAVGAWLTFLFWRTGAPKARWWSAYLAETAVAAGSTLPFFAAFSMPDVFAGYVVMGEVLLLTFWDRLSKAERIGIALTVGTAITFHTSHLLNSAGLVALAIVALRWLKAPRRAAVASVLTVCLAMAGAFLALGAYKEGVKLKTGDDLRRPPFLAMRVLADGPGREYLRASCAEGVHWALCPFHALPLDNSQDLLWSDDRKKGIFNVTTLQTRLNMEREENAFVLRSVLYDPVGQVVASAQNWAEQLSMFYVDDPIKNPHYYLTNDYWSTTNLPILIDRAHDCGRDHWGCGFRLSIDGSIWLHGGLLALGLITIGWRLSRRDIFSAIRTRTLDWNSDAGRLAMALGLLVATTLLNGFVCGALSGPFPRYQARITWIITAGAAISLVSMIPVMAALRWRDVVERTLAQPVIADLRRLDLAFLRFGMVGAAGFVVDYSTLRLVVAFSGLNAFEARMISFPVAVAATWLLNRAFTFRHPTVHGPLRQAATYVAVQCVGGCANIMVYSAVLILVPGLKHMLAIPLALGSIAGMFLNFFGSKHFAFKRAETPATSAPPVTVKVGEAVKTGG